MAFALRYAGNGRDDTWLQRADASAQQALALDNQLALAHVAHAYILELQGKQDQALTAIATALNLDPRNLLGLAGKARLLIRVQKFDAVKQVLDIAAAIYPRERLFPLILGTSLYRQGDYSGAELAFRKSIELDPQSVNAYAYLNAVLLRQNRNDEALRVLQQGLQFQANWELYTNLGTSLFAKGDYLGAIQAFEKAVSSSKGNPGTYQLWANLADAQRWIPAQAQASRRSYLRAIELLSPILARMPNDATVNSRMALYSAYVGAKKEAVEKAARAIAIAPSLPDIQFRAALTQELIGNHDAAMTALLEAVRLGYPINLIETAPDLLNLRRDARYQQFIINIKRDRKT